MAERRFTQRYPNRMPVKFGFGSVIEKAETENISFSGMFIKTHIMYISRTVIRIEFTLPNNIIVKIDGEVRWKREFSPGWLKKNGLGIKIVKFYLGEQKYKEIVRELQARSSCFTPTATGYIR